MRSTYGVKRTEFARAIRLTEVVHNVNYKGDIIIDNDNFYESPEKKYIALRKLLNA
jgi:hypothetical protein